MNEEKLDEYVLDMFRMVWRDAQIDNSKDAVCSSATRMVMNRVKEQDSSRDRQTLKSLEKGYKVSLDMMKEHYESEKQQIALARDDEELRWVNGLVRLLGAKVPSGGPDNYILERHGILNMRIKNPATATLKQAQEGSHE